MIYKRLDNSQAFHSPSPWRGVGGEADIADGKRESRNAIGLTPFRRLPKMLSLERESHNAIGLTPFRGLPKILSLERESHNAIGLTP